MNRPGGEPASSWAPNEIGTVMLGEPTATLQYVRKISSFTKPSQANEAVFLQAVDEVAQATQRLLTGLVTSAAPKDREVEAERRRARAAKRFAAA